MKSLLLSISFSVIAGLAFGCTTFCINHNGQLLFGRNYDWVSGAGVIHVNKKNLAKTSFAVKDGKQISWTSRFGSITFNQYGKEFPTGGMNEKGLVVELMWLDETRFPAPDQRPALMGLQWIQYQLDNAATVDEVIASDEKVRISSNGTPLHYLIADAAGNVATIEFLNGKLIVHRESQLQFPVLTNTAYATALPAGRNAARSDSNITSHDNSLERFAKACRMLNNITVKKINTTLTDYAFDILSHVAQGDFTKWRIVYNITEKEITFVTTGNKHRRTLKFTGMDFNCNAGSLMYNLSGSDTGNINDKLVPENDSIRSEVLQQAANDSRQYVDISADEVVALISYSRSITCK